MESKYGIEDPNDMEVMICLDEKIPRKTSLLSKKLTYTNVGYQVENNRVVTLSLYGSKLEQFPKEILKLTALKKLNLWFNDLEKIPAEISKLTHLECFSIEYNKLSSLPDELFALPLHRLYLGNNKLTELPRLIGKLSQTLIYLNVFNNRITLLPQELFSCSKLQTLGLSDNPLVSIPEDISKLTALQTLTMEKLRLKSRPRCITSIKVVYMNKTIFLDEIDQNQKNSLK